MKKLLSTKEVAGFLDVNEKMVYSLISEKGLPASKVTGKWLFPRHLVEQWIETHTVNYPEIVADTFRQQGLVVITGSNDLLLEKTISLFNAVTPDRVAVFGNLGSMGGLRALRRNLCHMASSHLLQDSRDEYNFDFAGRELEQMPVVVNFCRREQGILIRKGNPKKIETFEDIGRTGLKIVNRSLGTGTRLLFDQQLKKAGINGESINGYHDEVGRHMDVGLEILSGNADAGPGIRPVASVLGLDFIPLRWERYDLLIRKERFFDQPIQDFLSMLHEEKFREIAEKFEGYDVSSSGRMLFQQEPAGEE